MQARYAIYYAPERDSSLDLFGKKWLGRCAETGAVLEQPNIPGLRGDELRQMTATPRHYGFHGTIVPPFVLSHEVSGHDIIGLLEAFAREQRPFDMEPLSVREIGAFIALVPDGQDALSKLAEASLRFFHPYREQPTLAELERRRSRGLTPAQERLLSNWGYPYVLEEFRFHITLTDSIRDKGKRKKVLKTITDYTDWLSRAIYPVRELCLFRQENKDKPFTLVHRAPLGS